MAVNKTELMGIEWLKKQGYTKEEIFLSDKAPTFSCLDGKRYEPRYLYGNQLLFSAVQAKGLKPGDIILVFDKEQFKTKFLWKDRGKIGLKINVMKAPEKTTKISSEIYKKLQDHKQENETIEEFINRILPKKQKKVTGDKKVDFARLKDLGIQMSSGIKGAEYNIISREYQEIREAYKDHLWVCTRCGYLWHRLEFPILCPKCKSREWDKPIVHDIASEVESQVKEEDDKEWKQRLPSEVKR